MSNSDVTKIALVGAAVIAAVLLSKRPTQPSETGHSVSSLAVQFS